MGTMRIKIREPEELRRIAIEELSLKILPKVALKVRDAVRQIIKELILEEITLTDIYNGIVGNIKTRDKDDIQAVMGLEEEEVANFEASFPEFMENLIQVNRSAKFVAGIDIFLNRNYIEQLSSEYQYESEGGTVPWMEWLLDQVNGVDYNILFGRKRDFPNPPSRTGRAVMVRHGGIPFDIGYFNYGGSENNFIAKVFQGSEVIDKLNNIVGLEFDRQIRLLR